MRIIFKIDFLVVFLLYNRGYCKIHSWLNWSNYAKLRQHLVWKCPFNRIAQSDENIRVSTNTSLKILKTDFNYKYRYRFLITLNSYNCIKDYMQQTNFSPLFCIILGYFLANFTLQNRSTSFSTLGSDKMSHIVSN